MQFRFSFFGALNDCKFAGRQEILDAARQQLFEVTIYKESMRFGGMRETRQTVLRTIQFSIISSTKRQAQCSPDPDLASRDTKASIRLLRDTSDQLVESR